MLLLIFILTSIPCGGCWERLLIATPFHESGMRWTLIGAYAQIGSDQGGDTKVL